MSNRIGRHTATLPGVTASVMMLGSAFAGWCTLAMVAARVVTLDIGSRKELAAAAIIFGFGTIFIAPSIIRMGVSKWARDIGWWISLSGAAALLVWSAHTDLFETDAAPLAARLFQAALLSLAAFAVFFWRNPDRVRLGLRTLGGREP